MAGERALPDLVSRIRVDSSGVEGAMSSLVASFGKTNLALIGLGAGIGLLIKGGQSMVDIAQAHAKAEANLAQAYTATGTNLSLYRHNIDDFIMSNRRYVQDQAEVITGYATLTRSGLTQNEVQKDINRAVDLSAIKNISLSEAVDLLVKAEHGRLRGLIDLGITTKDQTDADGNLIKGTKTVTDVMNALDGKLKDGRKTLTEHEQAIRSIGITYQEFAKGPGKELERAFTNAIQIGDLFMQFLEAMGHNNAVWDAIQDRFIKMAQWIKTYIIDPLNALYNWVPGAAPPVSGANRYSGGGRQHGGPVLPGGIYTVGENGPELLVMGRSGGMVIPGGNTYNYNLSLSGQGAVNDPEGARRMLQRMQLLGAAG